MRQEPEHKCANFDGCFTSIEGECPDSSACPRYEHKHQWVAADPDPVGRNVRCATCGVTAQVGLDHFERQAHPDSFVEGGS